MSIFPTDRERIDSLRNAMRTLRGSHDVYAQQAKDFGREIVKLNMEVLRLKAEIERKDAALLRIVDAFTPEVIHIGTMHNKYRAVAIRNMGEGQF